MVRNFKKILLLIIFSSLILCIISNKYTAKALLSVSTNYSSVLIGDVKDVFPDLDLNIYSTWVNIGWWKSNTTSISYGGKSELLAKWKKRNFGDIDVYVGVYRSTTDESDGSDKYLIISGIKTKPKFYNEQGYTRWVNIDSDLNATKLDKERKYVVLHSTPVTGISYTTETTNVGYETSWEYKYDQSFGGPTFTPKITYFVYKSETVVDPDLKIVNQSYDQSIHIEYNYYQNPESDYSKSTNYLTSATIIKVPREQFGIQFDLIFKARFDDYDSEALFDGEVHEWCTRTSKFEFGYTI